MAELRPQLAGSYVVKAAETRPAPVRPRVGAVPPRPTESERRAARRFMAIHRRASISEKGNEDD